MDVMEAIYSRRSVREYTGEPVEHVVIERLIDAAVQAPSAVNEQPWHFTVVEDQQKLDAISKGAKAHLLAAPEQELPSRLREMLGNPEFQIFYHAPVLILISVRRNGPWAVEDCALAAQNLMLAARAQGLGTCWIGFAQGWLQTSEGKTALGLPAACLPVAPIIVGRPISIPPQVSRRHPQVCWVGRPAAIA
jgi:nitroreductase